MEKKLRDIFPMIFDSINDGVFTVDEQFSITSFNSAAERITGVPRDQAIGQKCHDVFKASICQDGCALRQTLDSREPAQDVRVDILDSKMRRLPIAVSTAVLKDSKGQISGGVEIFRDMSDVETLRNELAGRKRFRDIIGQSHAMQDIFALIPQIAASETSVLINGASGTGKELVARAIHDLSPRKDRPFVRVNCGALPDTLLESELFGYVKGAFTGASHSKPGRFQQAHRGTLFLDEIGDVSPAFQVKLLRALEEGEVQALGDTKATTVDVRVISATNHDLHEMASEGRFREDLYYRIQVVPVDLPTLAERREDIPLLVSHFTRLVATRTGQDPPELTRRAMRALYDYDYPGNVRELRNIIERAFVLSSDKVVDLKHLPPEVVEASTLHSAMGLRPSEKRIAGAALSGASKESFSPQARRLVEVLNAHNWNRAATASSLGISRTTLWRRMKEGGLA